MSTWSLARVKQLERDGKIKGYKVLNEKTLAQQNKQVAASVEPEGLKFIKQQLEAANIPYCTELQFDEVRRFRFDLALPLLMIAIEYEGLVSTGKKGGHQTKKHYTKDTDKYNLAQRLGWKVYRYTALNYKDFENDLKTMI